MGRPLKNYWANLDLIFYVACARRVRRQEIVYIMTRPPQGAIIWG